MSRIVESLRYRRLRPDQRVAWQLAFTNASHDEGLARILASLNRVLAQPDVQQVQKRIQQLQVFRLLQRDLADLLPVLSSSLEPTIAEPQRLDIPLYGVSSMMLHDCHRYLTQRMQTTGQKPEWMLALTGLRIGNLLTLEHKLDLKLSVQSAACASADMGDLTRLLVQLSEFGQALHGVFHSHRFNGPPRPSATDMDLQEKLEQGRYPAIQAVFSEDGYVRFFAQRHPFEVLIYGKEVEKVGRYLYHLQQVGQVGDTGDQPSLSRRAARVSPLRSDPWGKP